MTGPAGELHELSAESVSGRAGFPARAVRWMKPTGRALVLGSTQPEGAADRGACEASGTDVVRRRSGGGAVLVAPGRQLWVDLVVPAGDRLWEDDVGRAAWWAGELWADALAAAGEGALRVWKGPLQQRPFSRLACFGGTGPGEVVDGGGSKLVGISQRRTRYGAVLQCSCLLQWDAAELVGLLSLPPDEAEAARAALTVAARAVEPDLGSALGRGRGTEEREARLWDLLVSRLPE